MHKQQEQQGLSAAEVAQRVARGQSNAYRARVGRSYWDIFRDNIFNVFNIVLFPLLGVIIAFEQYAVAFFAGFSVVSNALVGTIQEIIAKRRLDRLAAQQERDIPIWRDAQLVPVPVHDIVLDDVLPIVPGDRLVIDGVVLHSDALEMDESHLTGESDSVYKSADDIVHSGSFCIAGTGLMRVTKVGKDSTINQLSATASEYRKSLTPTQERINGIVQICIMLMLIFAPMLYLSDTLDGLSTLEKVKNAVVFVTSIVPYGLVLIVIISLSLGAISITRHQTLIRRVNAVESLANVTVLCFDKTGTITQNKLAVTEIQPLNDWSEAELRQSLRVYTDNLATMNGTAQAIAQHVAANTTDNGPVKLREIPFSSARKWGAIILPEQTLVLGAPERILSQENSQDILTEAERLSRQGLRVLVFARTAAPPEDYTLAADPEPLALIVLSDQIRDDIQATLQAFREQNVRLKVISGDNLETVHTIAGQAGVDQTYAFTGDQLKQMTEQEFVAAVLEGTIFARVEPDTKRRIIAALRQRGEYVAMVGDGVNDVPALKEADLAVVMNDGAAITKDIGDIILLNNAMSTLPLAFAEGKEITQTIFGTIKLFLVKTFYNVLLFIYVGFMGLPFAITPIQINWITFGTVNIVGTLVAFKILRPAPMTQFRRDVLDYIVTGAVIGSVAISLLYAVMYFASGQNTAIARSALSLFITLFGILIFWNVHGVDIFHPWTFVERWGVAVLGFVLMLMTLLGFYIAPGLLEFVAPPPVLIPQKPLDWTIHFIVVMFCLTMMVYSWAMKDRKIINSLWKLVQP